MGSQRFVILLGIMLCSDTKANNKRKSQREKVYRVRKEMRENSHNSDIYAE